MLWLLEAVAIGGIGASDTDVYLSTELVVVILKKYTVICELCY